jgi:hypothetical protein
MKYYFAGLFLKHPVEGRNEVVLFWGYLTFSDNEIQEGSDPRSFPYGPGNPDTTGQFNKLIASLTNLLPWT